MGTIKLPNNSIEFFKSNQNKIFESGNLAEGPWNEQLSEKIQSIGQVINLIHGFLHGMKLQLHMIRFLSLTVQS